MLYYYWTGLNGLKLEWTGMDWTQIFSPVAISSLEWTGVGRTFQIMHVAVKKSEKHLLPSSTCKCSDSDTHGAVPILCQHMFILHFFVL